MINSRKINITIFFCRHNESSATTMHQWHQSEPFSQNATTTSLSTETIDMPSNENCNQDFSTFQGLEKPKHILQQHFDSSQVTTPETCEQFVTNAASPRLVYYIPNNTKQVVKSSTKVPHIIKSTLTNAKKLLQPRKITTSNSITRTITSGVTSNAFVLPKTQISNINSPISNTILSSASTQKTTPVFTTSKINSGATTDLFSNQIPMTSRRKSPSPTVLSNLKCMVPTSIIQTMKNVNPHVIRKTSSQHSLLKPQPIKTVSNSQFLHNLQCANKMRLLPNNQLGRPSPGTLNGTKLSAIKPAPQPVISKSYSPTNFVIMPPNSPKPPRQNSPNVKVILLQPSAQSRKVTCNQAPINDWTNEDLTKMRNLSFETSNDAKLMNRKLLAQRPKLAAKRGRPKKDSNRPQVAEYKQPVSEEDQDDFKETKTRCGRLSRPPAHIINNYKHISPANLTQPDVDDSNGDVQAEAESAKELLPGLEGPKRNISDHFKCPTCKKVYLGRGKMAIHFEKNPTHGSVDQLPPPKPIPLECKKNNLKPKGKKRGPWVTPEEKSARRQANLQKVISDCTEAEISKIATIPVLKSQSLFDLMFIKSKNSAQNFLDELNNLIKNAREKIIPGMRKTRDEDRGSEGTVDLTQKIVCDALGLSPGVYRISRNFLGGEELSEDEEPTMKKHKADSEEEEQPLLEHRTSSGFSDGSDNSSNCLDYQTALPLLTENPSPSNEIHKPIVISNPQIQNELNENSGFRKIDINASFNNSFEKMSESSQSFSLFSNLSSRFENTSGMNTTQLESENDLDNEAYQYERVKTAEDVVDIFSNMSNSAENMSNVDLFENEYKRSFNVQSGAYNNIDDLSKLLSV